MSASVRSPLGVAVVVLPVLLAMACTKDRDVSRADAAGVDSTRTPTTAAAAKPPPGWRYPSAELQRAIDARLQRGRPAAVTAAQWRTVGALYDRTGHLPVWFDTAGGDVRARALVRELAAATSHGLSVDPDRLDAVRVALVRARNAGASADDEQGRGAYQRQRVPR